MGGRIGGLAEPVIEFDCLVIGRPRGFELARQLPVDLGEPVITFGVDPFARVAGPFRSLVPGG